MALSLRCADCGAQLRSVKEAQDHGEATGHANFEESSEAVLSIVCVECGKPCRSQTEQDLHTKRTGHAQFVDKTDEASMLDTEVEMKAAAQELKGNAMDTDEGQASGAAGGEASAAKGGNGEKVEPEVDEAMLTELQDMGFSRNKGVRALHLSGTSSLEQVVNWIVEHEKDADIDTPLLVDKAAAAAKKLTPEEAKAKAAELVKAAKARREAAEREAEQLREKERIRAGKELAAAAKLEDDLKLKRIMEARRLEREEEARAREKIRVKLEEDRRARRRRLGLPEELTEEEKEAERQKAAEKAVAAAKKKLPIKPVSIAEKLRAVLVDIKKGLPGQDERATTCFTTLMKICGNVAKAPKEEKFRKIRLTNSAIQQKVASVPGALQFLGMVGFKVDSSGEWLELPAAAVNPDALNQAGGELHNALTNPFFGKL